MINTNHETIPVTTTPIVFRGVNVVNSLNYLLDIEKSLL